MLIKNLPIDLQEALQEYFYNPYSGYVYIYNNLLVLKEIENRPVKDIMIDNDTVDGKYSIWKSIFQSIDKYCFPHPSIQGKTILDIGGKIGHFSIPFAEYGAKVVCLEPESLPCKVAYAISLIRDLQTLEIVNMTIQSYVSHSCNKFNVVLMLNVFDHVLRQGEKDAWTILDYISLISPILVLMMGPTDKISKDEIPSLVVNNTQYKHFKKLLSDSYGGRDLWAFTQ